MKILSKDLFGRPRPRYFLKEEPELLMHLSHTVWRVMILVLFGTLLSSVLFGVYLLSSALGIISDTSGSSAPRPKIISAGQLSSVADNIQERSQLFESFKTGTSTIGDPSR